MVSLRSKYGKGSLEIYPFLEDSTNNSPRFISGLDLLYLLRKKDSEKNILPQPIKDSYNPGIYDKLRMCLRYPFESMWISSSFLRIYAKKEGRANKKSAEDIVDRWSFDGSQ